MNFSQIISHKLADVITNELNYDEDQREIIIYAIEIIVLFIVGISLLVLAGYAFKALIPTLVAALFGGSLRRVSGGAHFDSPQKCLAFGTIVYCLIGILTTILVNYDFINQYDLMFGLIFSFAVVAYLAPVDSEAKPIHSKSFKLKLKVLSIIFLGITFVFINTIENRLVCYSAALGVVYQSLTLLPIFNNKRR